MDQEIFKDFDIVGVYPDQLAEEDAWKIGCATARFLPSLMTGYERGQVGAQVICVGRDMRSHSEPLAQALMAGIRSAGMGVIDIGAIDTPQMCFAVNHFKTCGGIQVTASHHPIKYNGFKICGQGGVPITVDTGLKEIEHLALAMPHTKGNPTGAVRREDLTSEYRKHVLQFLQPSVGEMKIAVDASNGMAGKMLPLLFAGTPIEMLEINFDHEGKFKHSPEPTKETNLRQVKSAVKRQKCHFGLCFDGDADRLMTVDEKGKPVGCDLLTALLAPYFLEKKPRAAVVYDVRSSRVVMEEIIKHGGTPRRERVGHAYVRKAMRDSHAVFGGELSGHFYYADNFSADSAVITLVHLLNALSEQDLPISELIAPLRRYAGSGEVSFKVENRAVKMEELTRRYADGQVDRLDGVTVGYKEWWFNCRPSHTEPVLRLNVEARTPEMLDEKLAELEEHLGKSV
ncbi:MAG: phosphomannomutase/phosphoglucomutase [Phycisphaerales bacterium]|nr:MAG: phosphomannomutase/phosphoglucomutase [Phycisphaerales bacterium]